MARYVLKYELAVESRLTSSAEEDGVLELANEFEEDMKLHVLPNETIKLIGVEREDARS